MSYGWAILVVVVVVVSLFNLGVLKIGGGGGILSSEGFPTLKPILSSCSGGYVSYGGPYADYHGLRCVFANPLGHKIYLTNVNVTVSRTGGPLQQCSLSIISSKPEYRALDSSMVMLIRGQTYPIIRYIDDLAIMRICPGGINARVPDSGCPWDLDNDGYSPPAYDDSDGNQNGIRDGWPVPAGREFVVMGYGFSAADVCWQLQPGDRFDAEVDIEYVIEIGGSMVVKHSNGKIHQV